MLMFDRFQKTVNHSQRTLFNTFWFVPAIVSLWGPLLALLFLQVDHHVQTDQIWFIFHGGFAEADTILATISGSLITVAGLAFSITIVVLQLVSSQYTPRALRGFLKDRVTQGVAGGFFAIFAYSLLVLATLREPSPTTPGFLPTVSITVDIGLGFLGLALLLIFVHHTGRVIQVSGIAAHLARQTLESLEHPYRAWDSEEFVEQTMSAQIQTWHTQQEPVSIRARKLGYVQGIDLAALTKYLEQPGFHLRLLICPGDFVSEETTIAEFWSARMTEVDAVAALHEHVVIDSERDIAQDPRFGARQLADIALRALSPAVNDPTTGVLCIKYLQAVFEHLVRRQPPPARYRFARGTSSLEIRLPTFQEYLEIFAEIGHYAGGNVRVIQTLVTALSRVKEIASLIGEQERHDLLATMIATVMTQGATQGMVETQSAIESERYGH
jgi:uncharacterized membrane protein